MEAKFSVSSNLKQNLKEFLREYGIKDTRKVVRKGVVEASKPIAKKIQATFPRDTGISVRNVKAKAQKPTSRTLKSAPIKKSGATKDNTLWHSFVGFMWSKSVDKYGGYSKTGQRYGLMKRLRFVERYGYRFAKSPRSRKAKGRNFTAFRPPKLALENALVSQKQAAVNIYKKIVGKGMEETARKLNKKNKLKEHK